MTVRNIPTNIKGLKWINESTFGTDPGSGYYDQKAHAISFDPTQNVIVPETQQPESCMGPEAGIPAGKGGELKFSHYLVGMGNDAARNLFAQLCSYNGFTVTDITATVGSKVKGATTSTIYALTSDIGAIVVGDITGVYGSGVASQFRRVTAVADDTPIAGDTQLTISPDFTDTPTTDDDFRGVCNIVPTTGDTGSVTFKLYEGKDGSDYALWTLTGCNGTWVLESTGPDTLPVITWTFQVDSWALTESSTTYSEDLQNEVDPILGDPFFVDDDQVLISQIAFDPGMDMQAYASTEGTNGRSGWRYVGCDPKVSFTAYHDTAWYTKLSAGTTFELHFESGLAGISATDLYGGWGLNIPKAQCLNVPREDVNGLIGVSPEIVAVNPGTTGLKRFKFFVGGTHS